MTLIDYAEHREWIERTIRRAAGNGGYGFLVRLSPEFDRDDTLAALGVELSGRFTPAQLERIAQACEDVRKYGCRRTRMDWQNQLAEIKSRLRAAISADEQGKVKGIHQNAGTPVVQLAGPFTAQQLREVADALDPRPGFRPGIVTPPPSARAG